MRNSYQSLDDHKDLLGEKGYFHDDFKPAYKMGMWLKELEEQYEQCRQKAHENDEPGRFGIELYGKFNHHLDTVLFLFRFEYNPKNESLRLFALNTKLGNNKKPYFLPVSRDLPEAAEVYKLLTQKEKGQSLKKLFKRLEKELVIKHKI